MGDPDPEKSAAIRPAPLRITAFLAQRLVITAPVSLFLNWMVTVARIVHLDQTHLG
jgi:hypothetical protein